MSKEPRAMAEFEQQEARRAQLFRRVVWSYVGGGTAFLAIFVVLWLLVPRFPYQYLVPGVGLFLLIALFCLWLGRRGLLSGAIALLMLSLIVALFTGTYFANGVSGPLMILLISLPMLTGLLAGPRAARHVTLITAVLYLLLAALEWFDVLQPRQMSGSGVHMAYGLVFLATLAIMTFIVDRFVDLEQRAVFTAQRRGQELMEMSQQAQHIAQVEREARERETRASRQQQEIVQEYITFLERVAHGDYSAQLELGELDHGEEEVHDLLILGDYLTSTVETLIRALQVTQAVQRRYVREAWEGFTAARAPYRGYRYRDPAGSGYGAGVEPSDQAWLTSMAEAIRNQNPTATECELSLPMRLRGEVIGALGARREEGRGWSDEEVALVATVTDQLAQTIESLRLLDETQRRAARERLTAEVTARMRESLDVETVLKTAAQEVRQVLGLPEVVVRLVPQAVAQADNGVEPSEV